MAEIESMDEITLCKMVDAAVAESVEFANSLSLKASIADDYYSCAPRGDEEDGYSSYISSQVADLVDADMASLAEVFLGAGQVVEFLPANKSDPKDAKEAQEKTAYIEHLIKTAPNSFTVLYGALMGIELHPVSVLRYGFDEKKSIKIKEHNRISPEVFVTLDEDYRKAYDLVEIAEYKEVGGQDGQKLFDVEFRLTRKMESTPYIKRVPVNGLIMSFDCTGKHDCRIIAERVTCRRGDLVAAGYPKKKVSQIPTSSGDRTNDGQYRQASLAASSVEWASEYVDGIDGFMRVDYDGDGIIECRRILKYGDVILENKEIENDPRAINFAFGSASLLPDNVIGMSRAERVTSYQDVMTDISRAMLDNTAQITRGRLMVNTSQQAGVDFFDMTGDSSIIKVKPDMGMPMEQIAYPLPIQPVAAEALTVIQFLDSQRAQSTGSLLANQGLKEDSLHKETATRFKGIDDSAQAKIRLVTRVIAETLIRDVYEGMCYYAQKNAASEREIQVAGQAVKVNPNAWSRDHSCNVTVGTGYGDNDKTIETIDGLLAISATLQGTGLSDSKKLYNLIRKKAQASGIYTISDYFNDPEQPAELLQAENEQLKQQIEMLKQQGAANDPLIQIEKMRQDVKVLDIQSKALSEQNKLIMDQQKLLSANALELTRLEQDANKQLDQEFTGNEKTVGENV